jgi:decaprenylphospho-beta-D-erythro-pentofuranosid-2-ulose 2-reductase
VILAGRDPESLSRSAEALTSAANGRREVRIVPFEAEDLASHGETVTSAWSLGDVDIVVVAFGQLGTQTELISDPEAAARLTTVNHTAAVSIGLHVASRMRDQGHGHIIALSSIAAERARPSNFIYGASKAGFDAFFDGLAYELSPQGVSVSILRPGFVRTRMTVGLDVPPLASLPSEVSETAAANVGRSGTHYVSVAHRILGFGLRVVPRTVVRRLP